MKRFFVIQSTIYKNGEADLNTFCCHNLYYWHCTKALHLPPGHTVTQEVDDTNVVSYSLTKVSMIRLLQ